jgi:hypothetical protein
MFVEAPLVRRGRSLKSCHEAAGPRDPVTHGRRLPIAIKACAAAKNGAFLRDDDIAKRTRPRPARYLSMNSHNHATFSELRELLKVAKQLRQAAAETDDSQYITLFITTAASLEQHARKRAFVSHGIPEPSEGHYLPDSVAGLN